MYLAAVWPIVDEGVYAVAEEVADDVSSSEKSVEAADCYAVGVAGVEWTMSADCSVAEVA